MVEIDSEVEVEVGVVEVEVNGANGDNGDGGTDKLACCEGCCCSARRMRFVKARDGEKVWKTRTEEDDEQDDNGADDGIKEEDTPKILGNRGNTRENVRCG